ncbi:MAG: hypothetical protein KC464_14215, partial [Myxococcales bacterium]|nr:hypothetical protein [Myxococcales bacterium]
MPPTPSRSPALARRLLGAAIALCTATAATLTPAVVGVAHAQPLDPYGPDPDALAAGAKDAGDPEIDEAVAAALVARARELIAMEAWADAQELLGEALVRSPDGAAAAEATALLPAVKAKLGIDAGGATSDP